MPLLLALLLAAQGCAAEPGASISLGAFRGTRAGGATLFPFIAYAEPPVGALRWRFPVPVKAEKQREAPVQCPQVLGDYLPGAALPESEDCLFLNVWTPEKKVAGDAKGAPVIFFIHGGGLLTGSGLKELYDGSVFARRGFVFVSFNYRLGELGYGPNLEKSPGSLGLMDQALALRWVEKNISRFGGDPTRIFLMGHSKGAEAVTALALSGLAGAGVRGGIALSGARHFYGVGAPNPDFGPGEKTAPAKALLQKIGFRLYVPQLPERKTEAAPGSFKLLVTVLYDETIGHHAEQLYCANLHFLGQFPPSVASWHYVLHSPETEHGAEMLAIFRGEPFGLRLLDVFSAFVREERPPSLWYGHRPALWRGGQEEVHLYPHFSFAREAGIPPGKGNEYFTNVQALCRKDDSAGSRINATLYGIEGWLRRWRELTR